MDNITKMWLETRINIVYQEIKYLGLTDLNEVAESFRFKNRKKKHPEEYEDCCKTGEFCHVQNGGYINNNFGTSPNSKFKQEFADDGNSEDVYCLLCSCNNYEVKNEKGGCKSKNPCRAGRFYDRTKFGLPEIWDCSDCLFPHRKNSTINFLEEVRDRVEKGEDLKLILKDIFLGE
jgi:Zn-finger protein